MSLFTKESRPETHTQARTHALARDHRAPDRAVQRHLAGRAVTGATGAVVQRCGGEVHEGCACAEGATAPTQAPGWLGTAQTMALQRSAGNRGVAQLLGELPVQRACCVWKDNDCTTGKRKFNSMHNATAKGFNSASLNTEGDPCVSGAKKMKAISEAECSKGGSC